MLAASTELKPLAEQVKPPDATKLSAPPDKAPPVASVATSTPSTPSSGASAATSTVKDHVAAQPTLRSPQAIPVSSSQTVPPIPPPTQSTAAAQLEPSKQSSSAPETAAASTQPSVASVLSTVAVSAELSSKEPIEKSVVASSLVVSHKPKEQVGVRVK